MKKFLPLQSEVAGLTRGLGQQLVAVPFPLARGSSGQITRNKTDHWVWTAGKLWGQGSVGCQLQPQPGASGRPHPRPRWQEGGCGDGRREVDKVAPHHPLDAQPIFGFHVTDEVLVSSKPE